MSDVVVSEQPPIVVALVDDYEVVLIGLAHMFDAYRDLIVIAEIDTNRPLTDDVDIALYDSFAQPEADHDEINVLIDNPHARRVVVYTWNFHPDLIASATAKGASGYVSKTLPARELVTVLQAVHAGEIIISRACRPRSAGDRPRLAGSNRGPHGPGIGDSRPDHAGQEQPRGRRADVLVDQHDQVVHPLHLPQDRRQQPHPSRALGHRTRLQARPSPHRPLARRTLTRPGRCPSGGDHVARRPSRVAQPRSGLDHADDADWQHWPQRERTAWILASGIRTGRCTSVNAEWPPSGDTSTTVPMVGALMVGSADGESAAIARRRPGMKLPAPETCARPATLTALRPLDQMVALSLDVKRGTLCKWVKAAREARDGGADPDGLSESERSELQRLRGEPRATHRSRDPRKEAAFFHPRDDAVIRFRSSMVTVALHRRADVCPGRVAKLELLRLGVGTDRHDGKNEPLRSRDRSNAAIARGDHRTIMWLPVGTGS